MYSPMLSANNLSILSSSFGSARLLGPIVAVVVVFAIVEELLEERQLEPLAGDSEDRDIQ